MNLHGRSCAHGDEGFNARSKSTASLRRHRDQQQQQSFRRVPAFFFFAVGTSPIYTSTNRFRQCQRQTNCSEPTKTRRPAMARPIEREYWTLPGQQQSCSSRPFVIISRSSSDNSRIFTIFFTPSWNSKGASVGSYSHHKTTPTEEQSILPRVKPPLQAPTARTRGTGQRYRSCIKTRGTGRRYRSCFATSPRPQRCEPNPCEARCCNI